jgi:hypothetical protein
MRQPGSTGGEGLLGLGDREAQDVDHVRRVACQALQAVMAGLLTMRAPETATLILSICIFASQFVVAAIAPLVGRRA